VLACRFLLPILPLGGDCEVVLNAELARAKQPLPRTDVSISYGGLDSLYIVGGFSFNGSYQNQRDILKYSLSQDTLELVGQLPVGVSSAFTWNDGNGTHYVIGGSSARGEVYRFQEGNESAVETVGSTSSVVYHPLPQPSNKEVIHLVLTRSQTFPRMFEFHTTDLTMNRTIPLPFLEGYNIYYTQGAAQVDDGYTVLIFSHFSDSRGSLPSRHDVVVKYSIPEDRFELFQTPIPPWQSSLNPFSDNDVVYLFAFGEKVQNCTTGIHRYDTVRNETEFFQVTGILGEGRYLEETSTFFVPSMNRLYIFGGSSYPGGIYRDEIWTVDLDPISFKPTTPATTTLWKYRPIN